MINIDMKRGTIELSGDVPLLCAEFTSGLRTLYKSIKKEDSENMANILLDEILSMAKMSDEKFKERSEEAKAEVIKKLSENLDCLQSLKDILDKIEGMKSCDKSMDNSTDTFSNMFSDVLKEINRDK